MREARLLVLSLPVPKLPDSQAVAFAHRQEVVLYAAHQQRVGRLLGGETLVASALGGPVRLHDHPGGEGRAAEVADLPGVYQVGQSRQRVVDVNIGARPVDLVKVDVVGAEAAEAGLAF